MELGLTLDKLLLIGVLVMIIVGPEKLPGLAERFAKFVRRAGEYLRDTKSKMKEEFGPEIDDVDWRKLDPRQYDPRRIIRDALLEEPTPQVASAGTTTTVAEPVEIPPTGRAIFSRSTPPPFDVEAT